MAAYRLSASRGLRLSRFLRFRGKIKLFRGLHARRSLLGCRLLGGGLGVVVVDVVDVVSGPNVGSGIGSSFAVTGARGPFVIFRAGSSWVLNDEAEPKIGGGVAPATPAASAQPSGSYLWIIEEHS